MFHSIFSVFPCNSAVGGVNVASAQPGGINDGVLSRIQHMEQREWLPKAAHLPSVVNLSCCYWLPRDSPHDARSITSAATTRGLSPRPWRLCGGVHSLQVRSMGINTTWNSQSFRWAAVGSTDAISSPPPSYNDGTFLSQVVHIFTVFWFQLNESSCNTIPVCLVQIWLSCLLWTTF